MHVGGLEEPISNVELALWSPDFPDDGCAEEDAERLFDFISKRCDSLRPSNVLLSLNPSTHLPDERDDDTRQQLLEDATDGLGIDKSEFSDESQDDRSPFEKLVADVADEEEIDEPKDFSPPTVPFEMNHPLVEAGADDEQTMAHQIGRMMARYKRRWGLENGFKKIKKFLCRTTSKDHEYRYFNFAFACLLYNCWRIVDLLVQLSIKDDPTYSPEINANLFLTIAKDYYGLDPSN